MSFVFINNWVKSNLSVYNCENRGGWGGVFPLYFRMYVRGRVFIKRMNVYRGYELLLKLKIKHVNSESNRRKVCIYETFLSFWVILNLNFRSIFLKEKLEPLLPALDQLNCGLETYGLLKVIRKLPAIFKHVFCGTKSLNWTFQAFEEFLEPQFSSSGTSKRKSEIDCFKTFMDAVEMMFHESEWLLPYSLNFLRVLKPIQ